MIGVTDVLAIYGAVLSTVAVAWNLYRDVHDRTRQLRKRLTAELYAPVRLQLTEAADAIRNDQRAHSINMETWRVANASGITKKLKSSLSAILAELYERTFPTYDKACQVLNEDIGRMAQEWDRKYADIHDFQAAPTKYNIIKIDWWKFLASDGPVTPIDGLRDGDVLRLLNSFMTPARFKLLDRSPEQFLIERWHEAARNDTLKQFRELRKRVLDNIPRAIALLDRNSLY